MFSYYRWDIVDSESHLQNVIFLKLLKRVASLELSSSNISWDLFEVFRPWRSWHGTSTASGLIKGVWRMFLTRWTQTSSVCRKPRSLVSLCAQTWYMSVVFGLARLKLKVRWLGLPFEMETSDCTMFSAGFCLTVTILFNSAMQAKFSRQTDLLQCIFLLLF